MFVAKMMNGDEYKITEEEMKQLTGKSGLVYFPSIKGALNLSSVSSIVPASAVNRNRLPLHDGGFAIKKHGTWIDERSGSVIDLHYYPYLAREMTKEEYEATKLLN